MRLSQSRFFTAKKAKARAEGQEERNNHVIIAIA